MTTRSAPAAPAPTRAAPPSTPSGPAFVWRVRHVAVGLLFLAVTLNTEPGRLVNDTKLDLVLRPAALLGRALHLWDPLGFAGQLQNQAYGYLFPMGPFFAGGAVLGVPAWVTQRLWWTLLLSVSYAGFVVLAGRLRVGSPWTRLVAGVGFALAPHVLTVLGRTSVEVWPTALTPWVLVPLVSLGAAGSPRRAAALSGLAVLAMGGVNAAVDLAAVLPAALWLLTRQWDRALLRLSLWWAAAVAAATVWWVVPLLTLGRFSPPFLDFIESAAYTTSTTNLVQTLRGTADWVAYLGEGASRAGWALLTSPLLVLMTVVLVAVGLLGIAHRRTPERAWLVALLAGGVALVTMGYVGPVDGLLAEPLRSLLDGALAPLRNVHKFDVLIRLALALGTASALHLLARGRTDAETRFLRRVVTAAGAFVVVGASAPFFALSVAPVGSYEGVPDYWTEAADWLSEHDATGRTLLLPGSRFAQYTWGTTGDEPMQALASTPWEVRDAVPLTSAGHIRWLDAVERRVAEGRGGVDLRDALSGGGVRYLLVRNDISYGAAGATRPATVRAALSTTPGVRLVASFGPLVGGGSAPGSFSDHGLNLALPAVEIYAVSADEDPRVSVVPVDAVARVVGGAEAQSLTGLAGAGPFVRTADEQPEAEPAARGPLVLTDTPRRREANFGIGTFGTSATLSADDPLRIAKPTRDYLPPGDATSEAVAVIGGVRALSASSSASDADAYPRADPGSMPFAAFDGEVATAWRPNPLEPAEGAWLSVDFGRAVGLGGARVVLDAGTAVTRLGIRTDRGDTTVPVEDDVARLPAVDTTMLRITLLDVAGGATTHPGAAVREVEVPGVTVTRTVRLPRTSDGSDPDTVVLSGDVGHGACTVLGPRPLCAVGTARTGEDAAGLDRTFTRARATDARIQVSARAVPSRELEERVARALDLRVRATSSSSAVPDLAASPLVTVDGDLGTAWVADAGDPDPWVALRWSGRRELTELQVVLDGYVAATRPTHVRIVSPAGTREADLDAAGRATFPALDTDRVTVHLRAPGLATTIDAYSFATTPVGLGVSEISLPGLTPALTVPSTPSARAVTFPCGLGPEVEIAGRAVDTAVTTTVGALLAGASVPATPCSGATGPTEDRGTQVRVPAGEVRVRAGPSTGWLTSSVVLSSGTPARPAQPVPTRVTRWGATLRSVDVGPRDTVSLLVVPENANTGWRARLGDRVLDRATVNGWQQGYVLPAGAAGTVSLDFTPDGPFRWGLLAGALLAPLLVVGALLPERRGRRRGTVTGGPLVRRGVTVVGVGALVLVGAWWGAVAAALALGVLALGRRRLGAAAAPALAVAAYLGAGAVLVAGGTPGGLGGVADQLPAQLLVLVALAATVLSLGWPTASAPSRPRARRPRAAAGAPTG